MLVIECTLVIVSKDLVSLGYRLELDFGLGALVLGNFVGMMLKRKLADAFRQHVQ